MTDRRGKTTNVYYDAANQVQIVEFPDQARVRYALDSIGRIAALTPPNGNQEDLDEIQLEGAKNILFNPLAEESRPYDPDIWTTPEVAVAPRYWEGGTRSLDSEGRTFFPLNSTVSQWEQKDTPASAGGRYVASFLAKKTDGTSGTTTARLEFEYRLHKDYPDEYHHKFSDTIVGTSFAPGSTSWEQSDRDLVEIPADIQASWKLPALSLARIKRDSGSAPLGVKNVQLQRLSACLEYDGENLREICLPDGARQRVEFDRFGRPFLSTDPNGRTLRRYFDALDRVVHVVDSLGNELFFEYNETSDLTLFRLRSQGVDQNTSFEWDDLHRLTQITYPDLSTEVFTYTAAGDLASYQDNMLRTRSFSYDSLHRLTLITYSDSTTVGLTYDQVGNLTKVVERSSEEWSYGYDSLNRLTLQVFTSGTDQVGYTYRYNENGQRMALGAPPTYGVTHYGDAVTEYWSVPSLDGRDDVGRLKKVDDSDSNRTSFDYDVDGRCTQLSHSNSIADLFSYDIVGKLLDVTVKKDSETLMQMSYGYNLGQDRISQNTDQDTFIYLTDDAGRLVEESHNRFCVHQETVWKQGQWQRVSFDRETGTLSLLELNDDFADDRFKAQRWSLNSRRGNESFVNLTELTNVGVELRQDEGLRVAYPRCFSNLTIGHEPPVHDYPGQDVHIGGIAPSPQDRTYALDMPVDTPWFWVDLRHAVKLQGDFDIALDYEGLQSTGYNMQLSMGVSPTSHTVPSAKFFTVNLAANAQVSGRTFRPSSSAYYWGTPGAVGTSGQLRLVRSGSTMEAFHRNTDLDSWTSYGTDTATTADYNLSLEFFYQGDAASIAVKNFRHLDSKTHAAQGTFISPIYDAGRVVSWDDIRWTESLPSGCNVELEVCVADDFSEFENFASPPAWFGPSGTGTKFTTPGGENLPSGTTGRYAMIRATLAGNTTATPTLSDIQLSCNAASDVGSRVIRYRFDEAGNILEVATVTNSGTELDTRDDPSWSSGDRINTLNQIKRQDVGGDSWAFSWDANGNLTEKTNGTDVWTYTWDLDNRLTRVEGPGLVDVSYTYDAVGRVLTRDDGTLTKFSWDGFDCVRETAGSSITSYLIPEGMLLSFNRDGDTYFVSCDALGSVRLVTDQSGAVVSRFEYGAYGDLLAGSFDGVPSGMPYTWVGALGVRFDELTGLSYMRQRWYSKEIGRFISRDPMGLKGGANPYAYCSNSPAKFVDPSGTNPILIGLAIAAAIEAYREAHGDNAAAIDADLLPTKGPNGRIIWKSKGCVSDRSNIVASFAPTKLPGMPELPPILKPGSIGPVAAEAEMGAVRSTYQQLRDLTPNATPASQGLINSMRGIMREGESILENQAASGYVAGRGIIRLAQGASRSEAWEEFLHYLVERAGIEICMKNRVLVYEVEIMIKQFLVENASVLGIYGDDLIRLQLSQLIYLERLNSLR